MCFPVKFAKCLRAPFLENTSGRLLQVIAKAPLGSCKTGTIELSAAKLV